MVVGLGFILLFLFVPETFWDRTPTRRTSRRPSFLRRLSSRRNVHRTDAAPADPGGKASERTPSSGAAERHHADYHVGFAPAAGLRTGEGGGHGVETPGALDTNAPEVHEAGTQRSSWYPQGAAGSDTNVDYPGGGLNLDNEKMPASMLREPPKIQAYTHNLRQQPAQTFVQQLRPYHGRLQHDKWLKVMVRPFILFAYPAVLWSSATYACSIGWLIVISETMTVIYRDPAVYNFNALQTGLVYISPFVGGILGTGVAGKVSDIIVRAMSRRNGGLYEPEFRLVMALPVLVTTCIGLMGFGWSAQQKDHWIVPTIFFGVLSFGCALGSTTSITFCVDSYRQYAGEALVTLNFSKNVLHGLVFSLFVAHWMAEDGPKRVYIWLGVIQLILCLFTIPLYIYGKRARMWTVRMNLMEKF